MKLNPSMIGRGGRGICGAVVLARERSIVRCRIGAGEGAEGRSQGSQRRSVAQLWGTIVNREGYVCAVAFTGADYQSQWLGSRVISAQKANTPTRSILGRTATPLATSGSASPVWRCRPPTCTRRFSRAARSTAAAQQSGRHRQRLRCEAEDFGTGGDPLVGKRVGGVNVFGGASVFTMPSTPLSEVSASARHVVYGSRDRMASPQQSRSRSPQGRQRCFGDAARPDNIVYDIVSGQVPAASATLSASSRRIRRSCRPFIMTTHDRSPASAGLVIGASETELRL